MSVRVILDGQFGSCGKGAFISAALKMGEEPIVVVRAGGPQAGHSMLGPCPTNCTDGHDAGMHVWKMRQIPCAWHIPGMNVVIARGAMVNLAVLRDEIEGILSTGLPLHLLVDGDAFVVETTHQYREEQMALEAGSTREGVGIARAATMTREAKRVRDFLPNNPWLAPYVLANTASMLRSWSQSGDVWIEGTQGFGLSLRASGYYPYVTSWDITPQQLLADVGLHWKDDVRTTMLIRTYPIRIAGNSGPLDEIRWSDVRNPPSQPEITTVTKKQRRIGRFNLAQVLRAIRECRPDELVVTFADYLPELEREPWVNNLAQATGVPVNYVSTGFEKLSRWSNG